MDSSGKAFQNALAGKFLTRVYVGADLIDALKAKHRSVVGGEPKRELDVEDAAILLVVMARKQLIQEGFLQPDPDLYERPAQKGGE